MKTNKLNLTAIMTVAFIINLNAQVNLIGQYKHNNSNVQELSVAEPYLYLAAGLDGMKIIDISNPSSPTLVGTYTLEFGDEKAWAVKSGGGNYVYLGSNYHFEVIDVSSPSSPYRKSKVNSAGEVKGIFYSGGNYAYTSEANFGFNIMNISNPSSVSYAGYYDPPTNDWCYNVAVSGNFAYITRQDAGGNHLWVVDISNISSPTLAKDYQITPTSAYMWGIAISGNYAYIANGKNGLVILNISTPQSPVEVVRYQGGTVKGIVDVYVRGSFAYLADADQGLIILDISNPNNPTKVADYHISSGLYKIDMGNSYIYAIANTSDSLFIFDYNSSGINNISENSEIKIYPNPSFGKFTVQLATGKQPEANIEVHNVLGEKVYSYTMTNAPVSIDLSSQPKGIYFLKFYNGQTVLTKKIAIQ